MRAERKVKLERPVEDERIVHALLPDVAGSDAQIRVRHGHRWNKRSRPALTPAGVQDADGRHLVAVVLS
jgi:hypothetical protein